MLMCGTLGPLSEGKKEPQVYIICKCLSSSTSECVLLSKCKLLTERLISNLGENKGSFSS